MARRADALRDTGGAAGVACAKPRPVGVACPFVVAAEVLGVDWNCDCDCACFALEKAWVSRESEEVAAPTLRVLKGTGCSTDAASFEPPISTAVRGESLLDVADAAAVAALGLLGVPSPFVADRNGDELW